MWTIAITALIAAGFAGWLAVTGPTAGWDAAQAQPVPHRSPRRVFDLGNATVPRKLIRAGGPPVDGIPAFTAPKFVPACQADFLQPGDRVIGLAAEGVTKAFPLKILNYHEAVNDRIGDVPVVVTYCPLCDSAMVFDRRIGGQTYEFGISGLLYNSNVLLYDRRREGRPSLWSQMKAEAIAGPEAGMALEPLPFEVTIWRDWSARHPKTQVLSSETGYARNYARNPYVGYFRRPALMFPVAPIDRRLPLKARILGVWTAGGVRAYPLRPFRKADQSQRLIESIGEASLTVEYDRRAETFRVTEFEEEVHWAYSFWFAWAAFHPKTELYQVRPARP